MTRIQRFRSYSADAPWEMLFFSEEWNQFIDCVNRWCDEPVSETTGASIVELDAVEKRIDANLPVMMREWFRLVAHHPFCRHQAFNYLYKLEDVQVREEGNAVILPVYEDTQRFFWNISFLDHDNTLQLVIEDPVGKFYDDHQANRIAGPSNMCPKYALDIEFNELSRFIFQQHLVNAFRPDCLKKSAIFGLSDALSKDAIAALTESFELSAPNIPNQFWPLSSEDLIISERNFIALNAQVLDHANSVLKPFGICLQSDDATMARTG